MSNFFEVNGKRFVYENSNKHWFSAINVWDSKMNWVGCVIIDTEKGQADCAWADDDGMPLNFENTLAKSEEYLARWIAEHPRNEKFAA